MGTYIEKNLQAFAELQIAPGQSPTKHLHARDVDPVPERPGAARMQGLMGTYLEQSEAPCSTADAGADGQGRALFPGMPAFSRCAKK